MEAHRARRSANAWLLKAAGTKQAPTAVTIFNLNKKIKLAKEYLTFALETDTERMEAVKTDDIANAVMTRKDPKESIYDDMLQNLDDVEESASEYIGVSITLAGMYVERSRLIRDLMEEAEKTRIALEQADVDNANAFRGDDGEEEEADGKAEGKIKAEDKHADHDDHDSHEEQRAERLWHDSDCQMMEFLKYTDQEKLAEVLEDTTF
ncbi:hypothetical protein N0V95_004286 [Ascochyta clinopodiicola]|nr:hypothetical protein N0V95_004286 [Ascochyta clinopodiicola]